MLALVAGRGRVRRRALPRFSGGLELACRQVEQAQEGPRLRQPSLVGLAFEDRDRPGRFALRLLSPPLGVGEEPDPEAEDDCLRLQARLGTTLRSLGRLGDHLLQPPEVARLEQGERELRKDLLAQRVVVRGDALCAGEQVDGRGHVAARESPAPCRCESRGCPAAERDGALVPLAELGQRHVRTFEVEPHDLLSLSHPLPGLALDPRREPLMQVRASSLGDPAVRGVDREDVREAKSILVAQCRAIRNDQLLPGQRLEVAADVSPLLLWRERGYGSPPEDSPDDRRALDNGPLSVLEPVEARGEERVDRRRDPEARQIALDDPAPVAPLEQVVVDEHPQGLADEQRVPFGRLGDPRARIVGELPPAE